MESKEGGSLCVMQEAREALNAFKQRAAMPCGSEAKQQGARPSGRRGTELIVVGVD
jgi:hypothetical protein